MTKLLVLLAAGCGAFGDLDLHDNAIGGAEQLHVCSDPSGATCAEIAALFASTDVLTLSGTTYDDVVPDTIDLAEWMRAYYRRPERSSGSSTREA